MIFEDAFFNSGSFIIVWNETKRDKVVFVLKHHATKINSAVKVKIQAFIRPLYGRRKSHW